MRAVAVAFAKRSHEDIRIQHVSGLARLTPWPSTPIRIVAYHLAVSQQGPVECGQGNGELDGGLDRHHGYRNVIIAPCVASSAVRSRPPLALT